MGASLATRREKLVATKKNQVALATPGVATSSPGLWKSALFLYHLLAPAKLPQLKQDAFQSPQRTKTFS